MNFVTFSKPIISSKTNPLSSEVEPKQNQQLNSKELYYAILTLLSLNVKTFYSMLLSRD